MEKASYKGTDIFIKALRRKNATAAYPKKEVKPSIKRKTTLSDCVRTIALILLPNSEVNRGPITEPTPLISRAERLNKIPKVWSERLRKYHGRRSSYRGLILHLQSLALAWEAIVSE